jgi:hypothetical protein
MSITQDGYTYPAAVHGKIQATPPDVVLQTSKYPAVSGESHLIGRSGGRDLWTTATLRGYSTPAALDLAIALLNRKVSELTGRLTVTGSYAGIYDKCTFVGFYPDEEQHQDPYYGWMTRGILRWRQRDPNTIPDS